jgi:antitoxin component YwqK of YwqJK toxin-antitoxin module
MKNSLHFSLAFLLIFAFSSYAQNDTIWYDTNWKKTTKNNASFYRGSIEKKGKGFWVVDHYISGSKQMEGILLEEGTESYDGVIKWYHENGNVFQIVNYQDGILNGKRQVYHENGKLKSETTYGKGKMNGKWKELYENGNLKETGEYEEGQKEGSWKTFYTDGKLKEQGNYVFDRKVDIWITNYYDGTIEN